MGFGTALVLFAHPDDAEFSCGGTVARWAREGTSVHYVCVTDGSAGSNEPGATREALREIRETEQRAAARVLGVESVTFLGYVDGLLEHTLDLRRDVTREVRRLRPDLLIAPDPSRLWSRDSYVNHRDHRIAGEAGLSAVMPDAPTRLQFPELLDEGLEPFEIPNLWLPTEEGETLVDITDTLELKLKALSCHVSQGTGEHTDRVRERAAELGRRGDVEYAEAFRAFKLIEERED
jgi:LmbE family N-acetylglucosaminyl deacetylase